jgi:hypothetical protein
LNDEQGEEMDLVCKPVISMGRLYARNDPTGTVTFQYKLIEDTKVIDDIFEKKIRYFN